MDKHEDHLKMKPIHTKEYEVKQSKYHQCGHLPMEDCDFWSEWIKKNGTVAKHDLEFTQNLF